MTHFMPKVCARPGGGCILRPPWGAGRAQTGTLKRPGKGEEA